jgi:DNA-binding NarL/FixJ family response regulator
MEQAEDEIVMSKRESEVASCYLNGLTRKEIAAELVISENTVKKHMSNVFKKTGVKSRAELYGYMKKRVL